MVVLEKCGSSLADLHNAHGFESKIICTLTFDMANTPLVTCRSVLFDAKTTYFYYFIYLLFIIFILFLYYFYLIFYYFGFLSRFDSVGFRVGSGRFRVVPARLRVIPVRFRGGSGWFRVGSSFYIHSRKFLQTATST